MGYGLCQRRAPAASMPDDQKPGYNRALWCRVLSGDGCGDFKPIIPVRRAWVYGVWRGHRFYWWWVATYEGLILVKKSAEGRIEAFDAAEATARALYQRTEEQEQPEAPPGPRYRVVLRRRKFWILDNYLPDDEPVGPYDDRQQAHDERDDLEELHSGSFSTA